LFLFVQLTGDCVQEKCYLAKFVRSCDSIMTHQKDSVPKWRLQYVIKYVLSVSLANTVRVFLLRVTAATARVWLEADIVQLITYLGYTVSLQRVVSCM